MMMCTLDKYFDRSIPIIVTNFICMLGFLLLMFVPRDQVGVLYFAVCLSKAGSVSYKIFAETTIADLLCAVST